MRERQRSPLPTGPAPARRRAARAYGQAHRLLKETGGRIKETALRLLPGYQSTLPTVQRANRAAAADVDLFPGFTGADGGWARTEYGEYYATSVPVYSAIRLRAEALSRAPVIVYRTTPSGGRVPVERDHPARRILERVNRWLTVF